MALRTDIAFFQVDARQALKQGLASLPTPRNDYEIVVPADELQEADQQSSVDEDFIPDQSDIDANRQAALKAQSNCAVTFETFLFYHLSHPVCCIMVNEVTCLTLCLHKDMPIQTYKQFVRHKAIVTYHFLKHFDIE